VLRGNNNKLIPFLGSLLLTAGCLSSSGSSLPEGSVVQKEKDVSGKMALALGGVAEGWELLDLDESPRTLDFTTRDTDLLTLSVPEGFQDYTESGSVTVTALGIGIGFITPNVNLRERDPVQVTIPPQKLIQILLGEARGQMTREATLDNEEKVKQSSVSVTGDAIGAVVRNRIELINNEESPGLFEADPDQYESNPPLSYYEAVIEAGDGDPYQFSPLDPSTSWRRLTLKSGSIPAIESSASWV